MARDDPFTIFEDSPAKAEDDHLEGDSFESNSSVQDYGGGENEPDILFSDHAVPSIEHSPFTEPKLASSPPILPDPSQASRRMSALTSTTTISSFPPSVISEEDSRSPYTPLKERPAFRNPSSIRAMQMASPPPFSTWETYSSPRMSRRRDQHPSRTSTPMSMHRAHRSHHAISSSSLRSQSDFSERSHTVSHRSTTHGISPAEKKRYPLVLLHITLLPVTRPWSQELMESVLPERILNDYRRLEEALSETVSVRGVLISHPREEYDMLEERLLESLELRKPRVGPCGHFWGGEADNEVSPLGSNTVHDRQGDTDSRCKCEVIIAEEERLCQTCQREMMVPGSKRWDVRVYAANGLMRAGAWSAAWSEMERVDAEVDLCIPSDIRTELDRLQAEEDDRFAEAEAKEQAEFAERREREAFEKMFTDQEWKKQNEMSRNEDAASEERSANMSTPMPSENLPDLHGHRALHTDPIPLTTLLKTYLAHQAQDRRNIVILMLSAIVLLLAIGMGNPRAGTQLRPTLISEEVVQLPPFIDEDPSNPLAWSSGMSRETTTTTATVTSYMTSDVVHGGPDTSNVMSDVVRDGLDTSYVARSDVVYDGLDTSYVARSDVVHDSPDTSKKSSPQVTEVPNETIGLTLSKDMATCAGSSVNNENMA
ncbi:hypothetical protein P152DRAFT_459310 [Eremomyces bilateralis CBS 781.70]|uniref:Pathway-specific nitrogen regulator n=1 Tax=Eremomyces bilateralis CBS 781.70 TaxID=1392243 RepID=A0A6G1G1D2_9PEZI|nr:uncharacterized protein P152DRAFT_459310 [Eremomyces bilateralis CBS 781.70]KAF1811828.1 hypothetical protein P152DRAFT_459310 [Eremomyces bilateralis CBS 781.70]